jgi:hypothetical protein
MGPPKFFDVSLPACHGLWPPADRPLLANSDGLVLPSGALKPSASATGAFSKLFQHFRVRGHPYGLQDALSTLRPSCSPWVRPRLRHGRKTRYGWVARPYPTGTFTLLETPSLLGATTLSLSGGPQERLCKAPKSVRCGPSVSKHLFGPRFYGFTPGSPFRCSALDFAFPLPSQS